MNIIDQNELFTAGKFLGQLLAASNEHHIFFPFQVPKNVIDANENYRYTNSLISYLLLHIQKKRSPILCT